MNRLWLFGVIMRPVGFLSIVLCQAAWIACATADEPDSANSNADAQITWHRIEKLKSLGPICFRMPEFPDNSFRLVFPEWITSRQMNWHVRPVWKTGGNTASGTWESGPYSLKLQIKFSRQSTTRTLAWEYLFRNDSESALTDVAAFNCFTLADAPSFLDLSMQRTWVSQGKESPVTLSTVKKTKGRRTMQFYAARGGLKITEFERFMRYGVTSTEQLTGDHIGVTSRDRKWTVESIVDGRVAYFFNNWEPTHGCIHAAPMLGDVAAGKTGKARGRIVFTRK